MEPHSRKIQLKQELEELAKEKKKMISDQKLKLM